MERLLIILAVLVCVAAGTTVVAMASRGRRPPLRLGRELDESDEALLLGASPSPIDRSAPILDAQVLDLPAGEPLPRIEERDPGAGRGHGEAR